MRGIKTGFVVAAFLVLLFFWSCSTEDPDAFYPCPWVLNEGEYAVRSGRKWYRFDSEDKAVDKAKALTQEEVQDLLPDAGKKETK